MNQSETALLQRIEAYRFDMDGATKTFADRLAKENGWSRHFTDRVLAEYRRFAFLVAATNEPVSPSDAIDQAWHLHLLYTRTYWDEFCGKVLGRPLHHEPSAGLAGQDDRFAEQYAQTLANYRRYFGEPPSDIWPTMASGHRPIYRRIDTAGQLVLPYSLAIRLLLTIALLLMIVTVAWWFISVRS